MSMDGSLDMSVCGVGGEIWLFFRCILKVYIIGFVNGLDTMYEKKREDF